MWMGWGGLSMWFGEKEKGTQGEVESQVKNVKGGC